MLFLPRSTVILRMHPAIIMVNATILLYVFSCFVFL